MKNRSIVLTLLALGLAGCTPSSSSPATQTNASGVNLTNTEALTEVLRTNLPPLQAGERIAEVYREFKFKGLMNGGLFGTSKPEGDFFNATVSSMAASGERITATCKWIRENETEVTLRSTLPSTQHQYVAKRIAAALSRPATTRPANKV